MYYNLSWEIEQEYRKIPSSHLSTYRYPIDSPCHISRRISRWYCAVSAYNVTDWISRFLDQQLRIAVWQTWNPKYFTATIECDWWSNTVFVISNGHDLGYCYVWFLRFLPIIKTILVAHKRRDSLTRFIVRAIKKHATQESQHFLRRCFIISTIE